MARLLQRGLEVLSPARQDSDARLRAVLFTDVVATATLARVGYDAWRDLIERHHGGRSSSGTVGRAVERTQAITRSDHARSVLER